MVFDKFYKNNMIRIEKTEEEGKTICKAILLDEDNNELLEYHLDWIENTFVNRRFVPKANIDEISESLINLKKGIDTKKQ